MKVPTMDHFRQAVTIAEKGGKKYRGIKQRIGYTQSSWCGTSCCVWGHALLLAGNKEVADEGANYWSITDASDKARRKFMMKSKRHLALGYMMETSTTMVLPVLKDLAGTKRVNGVLKKALESRFGSISENAMLAIDDIDTVWAKK